MKQKSRGYLHLYAVLIFYTKTHQNDYVVFINKKQKEIYVKA